MSKPTPRTSDPAGPAARTPAKVRVGTPSRAYDVTIGPSLLGDLGAIVQAATPGLDMGHAASRRAALVADANLPDSLVRNVEISLSRAGYLVARISVEASEESKSITSFANILSLLAAHKLGRDDAVIALGGGVVGDLAGFVAATYRRGVALIQCPTTLLAMVDASIGGKTGVNLTIASGQSPGSTTLLKNAVGAFHQPHAVVASLDTLASLPEREFRCGLAECVKHAILAPNLGDPDLLAWMEREVATIQSRDPATLATLVARNVAIKGRVVEADERESSAEAQTNPAPRALLNLGHTFAHAIESLPVTWAISPAAEPPPMPLKHGEAVSLGLLAACATAQALGHVDAQYTHRIRSLLGGFGLPTHVEGLPPNEELLQRMAHDKKSLGGRLRLVLPTPTSAVVVTDPPREAVLRGLDAIRSVRAR